jgi:hypothetical protein
MEAAWDRMWGKARAEAEARAVFLRKLRRLRDESRFGMRLGRDWEGLGRKRSGWDADRSGLGDLRAGDTLVDGRQHDGRAVDEGRGLPGDDRVGCGEGSSRDGGCSVDLDAGAVEELARGLLTFQGGGAAGHAADTLGKGGRSDGNQCQRDEQSSGHDTVLRRMRMDGKLEVTPGRTGAIIRVGDGRRGR